MECRIDCDESLGTRWKCGVADEARGDAIGTEETGADLTDVGLDLS
jgi:hypothetical protein